MNLALLHGLMLASCRFSRSGTTFEFIGKINGQHRTVLVSTSYTISDCDGRSSCDDDQISGLIWPLLEKDVSTTDTDDSGVEKRASIQFHNGRKLIVSATSPFQHELLLVSVRETNEWFTVP